MARVCVLRQFYVPDDPRVRREVRALLEAGHEVDVICMRQRHEPACERDGALTIHRLPMRHRRGRILRYLFEYVAFPALAAVRLALLDARRRFDLVQVNTVPDWLVFASIVPRLRGVPVLLDLHECMPEFLASKFGKGPRHPVARLAAVLETASIRFATASITCTEQMRQAFIARGAPAERISIVMNAADESLFDPLTCPAQPSESERFVLISHGTIEERYGLDTVVRAIGRLRDRIPGLALEVYGDGSYLPDLRLLVDELELTDRVAFHGFVPLPDLVAAIAGADAGVVAMKRDAFRDLTHCNKMFDLITMRRPVICSRTRSVMAYFPDDALQYFDAGDDADLARAIAALHADPERSERLVRRASAVNEPFRWPNQREDFLRAIHGLMAGSRTLGTDRVRETAAPEPTTLVP